MDNGRKSINEMFNGCKFFSIPYYQRGYAWGDKQLLDFFEDFNTQYSLNSYYYGTILLFNKKGSDRYPQPNQISVKTFLFIFLYSFHFCYTLFLVLSAVYFTCKARGKERRA